MLALGIGLHLVINNFFSIQGDFRHTYYGDRSREEIVGYAIRMASPPIVHLPNIDQFKDKLKDGSVFFLYAGQREGELWVCCYYIQTKLFKALGFIYLLRKT